MAVNHVTDLFQSTMDLTRQWLNELGEDLDLDDPAKSYRVLRATLHALRDRMIVDEAANLGAQLPMLVRGFYFEGWKPSSTPRKLRTKDEFLARISEELVEASDPDPETAARAVFRLLANHVSPGEISDVRSMLPGAVRDLWPEPARRA